MKMSEAYDRTKKLERMISDLQHSIKTLECQPIPDNNTYCHSIAITTLEAKRQELIEAVAELGNMDVVKLPEMGSGGVSTPKDNQAAQNIGSNSYEQQHGVSPLKAPPFGKELVGKQCLFSNDGKHWTNNPMECDNYEFETDKYYCKPTAPGRSSSEWRYAKLYYIE